jgi:phospholipid transport system substrate-binding protein
MITVYRAIFLLFLFIAAPLESVHADDKRIAAETFVANLGASAIALVTDKSVVGETRREKFRKLLNHHVDLNWIGQFVLGRNWHRATLEQRKIYLKLFEESIVFTYTSQFDDFSGQKFEVTGNGKNGRFTLVNSKIIDPSNPRNNALIVWRLIEDSGKLKIVDVVIEGISMSITKRNEYASIIERNGGKIEPLLARMQEIIDGLRKGI